MWSNYGPGAENRPVSRVTYFTYVYKKKLLSKTPRYGVLIFGM